MSDLLTDIKNIIKERCTNFEQVAVWADDEWYEGLANEVILMCNRAYRAQLMGGTHEENKIPNRLGEDRGVHPEDTPGDFTHPGPAGPVQATKRLRPEDAE
jgi:hypothetical protein